MTAKRSPSKFIIKEKIRLIGDGKVIEIGRNERFLNQNGITYILNNNQSQDLTSIIKAHE